MSRSGKSFFVVILLVGVLSPCLAGAQPLGLGGDAPVVFSNMQPRSPDGRWVAYVTADNLGMANATIWVANADGSHPISIAASAAGEIVTSPVWSPDSTQVAYLKILMTATGEFDVQPRYEIWRVARDGSQPQRVTDSALLNPQLQAGGKADLTWSDAEQIEFTNHAVYPPTRHAVQLQTGVVTSIGRLMETVTMADQPRLLLPLRVPLFKQCHSAWGNQRLGTCTSTLCSHGCAVTATAMVLAYYGANVDPGSLNAWLTANGGYWYGCSLYWDQVVNYPGLNLSLVKTGLNWDLIRQELNDCHPVIVRVPSKVKPGGEHWVVITGYRGDTFYINDSYSDYTTLDAYNNDVRWMIIYRGSVCQPACPTISLSDLPPVPCAPAEYAAQLTADNGYGGSTFRVSGGTLPPGLTLSTTGRLAGTILASGTFTFTVQATDRYGCRGNRSYTLNVALCPTPTPIPAPPTPIPTEPPPVITPVPTGTPSTVPEPATFGLLLAGLAGSVLIRYLARKRR